MSSSDESAWLMASASIICSMRDNVAAMAILRTTVREEIHFRYAMVIADAISEGKPGMTRSEYWGFVTVRFRDLIAGRVQPAAMLRQNLQLVASSERCEYCGSSGNLQWDHIIPLARRGPDTIDNLVRACRRCNQRKSDRSVVEWANAEALELSRLVELKYLKLLLETHQRTGTLDVQLEQLPAAESRIVRVELAVFPFDATRPE